MTDDKESMIDVRPDATAIRIWTGSTMRATTTEKHEVYSWMYGKVVDNLVSDVLYVPNVGVD